jgi:hypothetical protein
LLDASTAATNAATVALQQAPESAVMAEMVLAQNADSADAVVAVDFAQHAAEAWAAADFEHPEYEAEAAADLEQPEADAVDVLQNFAITLATLALQQAPASAVTAAAAFVQATWQLALAALAELALDVQAFRSPATPK